MTPEILKTKIEIKRLKAFFAILPATAVGGLILVLIVAIGLIDVLPNLYFKFWLLFAFLVSIFSGILIFYFKKNQKKLTENVKRWQFLVILNCLLNGLSWGMTSAFFYTILPEHYQVYNLLAVVIVLSSYFPVYVYYVQYFFVFVITLMLPILLTLTLFGNTHSGYMAFMLFSYSCLMLGFAKWFNNREFDRIRLQYELFEQNDKVKAANDSKSQFLASASHDLRQPLQALGFYIVMLSDFLREPNKKALFDKTLKAYQALEDLLNQLLNISKLNANLVDISNTHFSIIELFEKLKNSYELRAIDKGLSIEFKTDDYFVYSDIVSVERIMGNLLENALRYTNQGYIQALCKIEHEQIVLQVADSGIGIDKVHINKIFDEFYQVKNPERDRSKGFGLGLYAVERLARLLGTTIKVESEVGHGSIFSITLPVGKKPQVKNLVKTNSLINDLVLQEIIVLLVDDDDVVLDSISRLFLSWGCQVLSASSCKDAMDLVINEEIVPELLMIDYRLPDHKTGVNLVEDIYAYTKENIPAIILTGDTGEESLTHINQSGLAFLHKPVDSVKLKQKIKQLITNHSD